jgi:hypothetical protein
MSGPKFFLIIPILFSPVELLRIEITTFNGGKNSLFNKCCWENWISSCKKLKPEPCFSPYMSINSKWIEDLHIRPETLKLVQERAGNILQLICKGNDFLN